MDNSNYSYLDYKINTNDIDKEELLEKIKALEINIEQTTSVINREKDDITKSKNIKQLNLVKSNLQKTLIYYKDMLNYISEKTLFNSNYIFKSEDIGKSCNVFYNNVWITGKINNIIIPKLNEETDIIQKLNISLYGFIKEDTLETAKVEVSYNKVRLNKLYKPKELSIGFLVEAIYIGDGFYYEAEIKNMFIDYLEIEFSEYKGFIEKVTYDMIRLHPNLNLKNDEILKISKNNINEKNSTNIIDVKNKSYEFKNFVIPDNLKLNKNDNEQQRLSKRKKLKAMKYKYKLKIIENLNQKKQNDWKDFQLNLANKK